MPRLTDNTPTSSIYDERLDKSYHHTPETGHQQERHTVVPSKPSVPVIFEEKEIEERELRREWRCPILAREKLETTLNTLEKEGYIIFQVLPLSASQVQLVVYQEVDDEDE